MSIKIFKIITRGFIKYTTYNIQRLGLMIERLVYTVYLMKRTIFLKGKMKKTVEASK